MHECMGAPTGLKPCVKFIQGPVQLNLIGIFKPIVVEISVKGGGLHRLIL